MARLEDITVGCSVTGISGSNTVEIVAVKWFGTAAMEVTYKNSSGQAGNQLLFRVSAPVIKCKKTPRKKCSFVAEVRKKR